MKICSKLLLLGVLALATPAIAQADIDPLRDCFGPRDAVSLDDRIEACTQVLMNEEWQEAQTAALKNRGHAYVYQGDYEKAVGDFESWTSISPRDAEAHNALAWVLYKLDRPYTRMDDLYSALRHVTIALMIDPNFAEAFDTRAHVWEGMADNAMKQAEYHRKSAEEQYRKALQLHPDLQESIDGLKRLGVEK